MCQCGRGVPHVRMGTLVEFQDINISKSDLAPSFLGDLSQDEKLSEIKLPLVKLQKHCQNSTGSVKV